MSDPQFGIGNIGGGLEEGIEGVVYSQLSKTEEVLISIANQLSGLTGFLEKAIEPLKGMKKSMEGFKPVAKEMNKSKFAKATKGLSSMFKNIAGASPQAFLVQKLFDTLKPLLGLFKPFQVILDIISALLSVMVSEALQPMFEALQPLYAVLLSLMPVFGRLGSALGELIATVMVPFVAILLALIPVIEPIIEIIIMLITMAIEPLKAIFSALLPVLIPIIGIIVELIGSAIKPLMAIFTALMPVILPLITLAFIPLKIIIAFITPLLSALSPLFIQLGNALVPLMPLIMMVITGFTDFVNMIINVINAIMNALTLGAWEDISTVSASAGVPGLEEGGIVLSHGVYELGEGGKPEIVIPLDEWRKGQSQQVALLGAIHDESVAQSYHGRELVRLKEWKRIFE